jgi:hypothetical protein
MPQPTGQEFVTPQHRWFHAPTSFRLQTLVIRVFKGPRQTRLQPKTHLTRNAIIVDRRVTFLIHAAAHIRVLLWHRKLLQHHRQFAMEALLQPKLNKTALEEEWTKWLRRKLRTLRPWCPLHLLSILFRPNHSLHSFLFYSLESQGEIFVKGVVLSHPKNFKFWNMAKIH